MPKSFKDDFNPAMQFISRPEGEPDSTEQLPRVSAKAAPEGYKVNPLFLETRSKRLQLLLQPSLLERIKSNAASKGTSVNDYVHTLLEKALKEDEENV